MPRHDVRNGLGQFAPAPGPGFNWGSALAGFFFGAGMTAIGIALASDRSPRPSLPAGNGPTPLLRPPAPPPARVAPPAPPATSPVASAPAARTITQEEWQRRFTHLLPLANQTGAPAPTAAPATKAALPPATVPAPTLAQSAEALTRFSDLLAQFNPRATGTGGGGSGSVSNTPNPNTGATQRVEKLVALAADERTPENERRNAAVAAAVEMKRAGLKVVPDGKT